MENTNVTWISVVATAVTVLGTVIVAYFNRQNKPLKDIMTKTKVQGSGSLVEALGVLQKQLKDEQTRSDKLISDAQRRHQDEIAYYVEQLKIARKEIQDLRDEKDQEIADLRKRLELHEERLNESHIGTGK